MKHGQCFTEKMNKTVNKNGATEETRQQGYAAFPCSMYFAEAEKDRNVFFDTKLHWHSSTELLHFEKGVFTLSVNMETTEVSSECYVFVESNMLHAITSKSDYRESALLYNPSVLSSRNFDSSEQLLIEPLIHGSLTLPKYIRPDMPVFKEFDKTFRQIAQIFRTAADKRDDQYNLSAPTDQLRCKALMMLLISLLSDGDLLTNAPRDPDPKAEVLKQVLAYINSHYSEKIYLRDLAEIMNFNEQYFSRYFKKTLGMTCVDYINDVRIRHAKKLLRTTNAPVLDIAYACGFGNIGHFIQSFKRATGKRPMEYRLN